MTKTTQKARRSTVEIQRETIAQVLAGIGGYQERKDRVEQIDVRLADTVELPAYTEVR